ncbi:MAG: hypothetical protein K0R00_149 [Herbinix sp.]|jgi:NTP pyrophosphatase (non-canonical NTP hydrolase)|nr:hypothetical protein [Herbinix sp.]
MQIRVDGEKTLRFINNWSREVRALITQKGFSIDKADLEEKIVLLHTEVAELSDAFKKGKGARDEGQEVADILIRLMNIPCMFEEIVTEARALLKQKEIVGENYYLSSNVDVGVCREITTVKNPYTLTFCLHERVTYLGNICFDYLHNGSPRMGLLSILECIQVIIALCEIYSKQFLGSTDIEFLVSEKMHFNWSRPYRYNTDPKIFQA